MISPSFMPAGFPRCNAAASLKLEAGTRFERSPIGFPRCNAAASLKQPHLELGDVARQRFPRCNAAASLKHGAGDVLVTAGGMGFPRCNAAASLKQARGRGVGVQCGAVFRVVMPRPH